jgi:hypothetical protein
MGGHSNLLRPTQKIMFSAGLRAMQTVSCCAAERKLSALECKAPTSREEFGNLIAP